MTEPAIAPQAAADIPEEDALRAGLYDFLALMLAKPPAAETLERCAGLSGDDGDLGRAMTALARAARVTSPGAARAEFDRLFVGLGRGELLPYASFYLTGFLNEKPLATLRGDMAARGIERSPTVFEPEDNVASLMEMMAGLILGRFGDPAPLPEQRAFWSRHLAPWAGHFFADLEGAKGAALYAPLGAAGRAFMAIEREAFRLEAP